jgi:hypothetical protein
MKKITITGKLPGQVMEIVRELRTQGWTQGQDFDFAYNGQVWDPMTGKLILRYTIFTFYNEMYATLFALKYS